MATRAGVGAGMAKVMMAKEAAEAATGRAVEVRARVGTVAVSQAREVATVDRHS